MTQAVSYSSALVVNPSVPAKTVAELVALIKANPGKYSYASPDSVRRRICWASNCVWPSISILSTRLMPRRPGSSLDRCWPHAQVDSLGQLLQGLSPEMAGCARLAVMSKNASNALPDVPAIAAAGYAGLDGDGWIGVLVPAGTPKDLVALLNREIVKIVNSPEMKERFATLGLDPVGSTPEAFTKQMRAEDEKWAKVIRAGNTKAK